LAKTLLKRCQYAITADRLSIFLPAVTEHGQIGPEIRQNRAIDAKILL